MDLDSKRLEEYKEVNTNMRHFSNMRVAVLTLALALNGVLLQSFIQQDHTLILVGLVLLGIAGSMYFLIFDNRVTFYYNFNKSRAVELESELDFNTHRRVIPKQRVNATNATKLLYTGLAVFWFILIIYKIAV